MKFLASFILILISVAACTHTSENRSQQTDEVSIMAYNVENLFDTVHDPGTEDYTYLPLSAKQTPEHKSECNKLRSERYKSECLNDDWNEEVLEKKLERLTDVILQVNGGRGPDILLMEEVENLRVLKIWNEGFLKNAGYKHIILVEGTDLRGIDVAMISRLPLIGQAKLHIIPFKAKTKDDAEWMARSRGILESNFELPSGQKLRIFGVHFPSQANPTYWREQAIDFLNELQAKTPPEYITMAGGDFNIAAEEDGKARLYDRLEKTWRISHRVGCKSCSGTHMYKREWSFLDALLFDPRLMPENNGAWVLIPESIRIPNQSRFQLSSFMSPARFDAGKAAGVSDHLPLFAVIKKRVASETDLKKSATNP